MSKIKIEKQDLIRIAIFSMIFFNFPIIIILGFINEAYISKILSILAPCEFILIGLSFLLPYFKTIKGLKEIYNKVCYGKLVKKDTNSNKLKHPYISYTIDGKKYTNTRFYNQAKSLISLYKINIIKLHYDEYDPTNIFIINPGLIIISLAFVIMGLVFLILAL